MFVSIQGAVLALTVLRMTLVRRIAFGEHTWSVDALNVKERI